MDGRDLYIAHTHAEWFDFLSRQTTALRLDEVNFWFPSAQKPPRAFAAGTPIFFRLGAPIRKIGGYGFFASFQLLPLDLAWELFGFRNGAVDRSTFYRLLGRLQVEEIRKPVACMVLLDAHFWPDPRWIPWGAERGYADTGIQKGRTETDPRNVATLQAEIALDGAEPPIELLDDFRPYHDDERPRVLSPQTVREGQGAFRMRLLDAYHGACAITGEHTEPVLDAAHIQPYLGPRSNHPRNGLLLTKEFHTLFDRGLVTIEPPRRDRDDYRVRVSPRIRELWNNGHRYYVFDDKPLRVPESSHLRPSREALDWHRETVFEKTG